MRRLLCLTAVLLLMTSSVCAASWAVYDGEGETAGDEIQTFAVIDTDYGVGTSNISLFGPVAAKLPYGTNYVYWRNSQYVYCLAYSDTMELIGSTFSADEVTLVTYTTYSGYSGGQANWTTSTDTNFSLSAGNYLVWSDLGDYPTLYERGVADYAQTACIILCSFALYYLFYHLWSDIRQRYL